MRLEHASPSFEYFHGRCHNHFGHKSMFILSVLCFQFFLFIILQPSDRLKLFFFLLFEISNKMSKKLVIMVLMKMFQEFNKLG